MFIIVLTGEGNAIYIRAFVNIVITWSLEFHLKVEPSKKVSKLQLLVELNCLSSFLKI